jgi:hypothetical protein
VGGGGGEVKRQHLRQAANSSTAPQPPESALAACCHANDGEHCTAAGHLRAARGSADKYVAGASLAPCPPYRPQAIPDPTLNTLSPPSLASFCLCPVRKAVGRSCQNCNAGSRRGPKT